MTIVFPLSACVAIKLCARYFQCNCLSICIWLLHKALLNGLHWNGCSVFVRVKWQQVFCRRTNPSQTCTHSSFTKTVELLVNKPWKTKTLQFHLMYDIQLNHACAPFTNPRSSFSTLWSVVCGSPNCLHQGIASLGTYFVYRRFYLIIFIPVTCIR
jgi:hypothetical protein